jgi:hypothetical protein
MEESIMKENNIILKNPKDNSYQKKDLYTVGKLVNIGKKEIQATLRKKKMMVLIGIVILIISLLSGCFGPGGKPGYHYGAICIQDFSWIWRLF